MHLVLLAIRFPRDQAINHENIQTGQFELIDYKRWQIIGDENLLLKIKLSF